MDAQYPSTAAIWHHSNPKQNTFWELDADNPQNIKPTEKISDARVDFSEFTHGIVNQACLHELLIIGMANTISKLRSL